MLENITRGDNVYTNVLSVSKSGMSRTITLYIIKNNDLFNITYEIGQKLGLKMAKNGGLIVRGRGMDMCVDTVYNLSIALFGDSRALKNQHI
jgi:hypothetical protein